MQLIDSRLARQKTLAQHAVRAIVAIGKPETNRPRLVAQVR
jgi:hypothetical protein